eukprot:gene23948-biopygen9733
MKLLITFNFVPLGRVKEDTDDDSTSQTPDQ